MAKRFDGIYYIAFVDLVESTKFASKMGDEALATRIEDFVGALRAALENIKIGLNSGQIVKQVGDGVLILFNHFPDIVQWQLEFECALSLAESEDRPFEWRAVVHAGEVRFRGGDPISLATNHTFKLDKSGSAGRLILTDAAYNLALSSMRREQCEFRRCGEVKLKGAGQPLRLYRVVVKAGVDFLRDRMAHGRRQKSSQ